MRQAVLDLIEHRRTAAEIASWATATMDALEDERVVDQAVWDCLATLSGADIQIEPGVFLHGDEDFRDWLEELDGAA